jgi:hypothetical protein
MAPMTLVYDPRGVGSMSRIQLHHIGEVILAGLLQELADRGDLDLYCPLHSNCSLQTILAAYGVVPPFTFDANVALAPAVIGKTTLLFDGAHGVDVLARGSGACGLAVEAKLGFDRLAPGEFKRRFLAPVSVTGHTPQRIKGSMVAILNHRFLDALGALPLHVTGEFATELAQDWILVVRQRVWEKWNKGNAKPPEFARNAHVIVFEEIVRRHGDGTAFDDLIHRLVGTGFYSAWDLGI